MKQQENCGSILIVEDNESLLDTFKTLLESEGYHVVTAKNGQEALDVLDVVKKPCLILLDMFMPVLDGWQFLEKLKMKEGDLVASLPIVICSAAGDKTVKEAVKSVRGFLKKPIELNALLEIVKSFCSTPV